MVPGKKAPRGRGAFLWPGLVTFPSFFTVLPNSSEDYLITTKVCPCGPRPPWQPEEAHGEKLPTMSLRPPDFTG